LTTNPGRNTSPATRAAELVVAWRKFVKKAKLLYGYTTIPYFAVFEATKAGQPHLHILCRVKWIDQRVLSAYMRTAIGAPIVDIRRCNSTRAAAKYVSKYVGKAPGKFGTCKRYWQTKDYDKLIDQAPAVLAYKGAGWRIVHQRLDALLLHHTIQKHKVEKLGPVWSITTAKPP